MVLQIRQSYDADSDRLAIEDVIAQYAYRWDSKDASGFANCLRKMRLSSAGCLAS